MKTFFAFTMIFALSAMPGVGVEVDLATSAADLTIWGGVAGAETGQGLQVGDINGDGVDDLLFVQPFWRDLAGDEAGRLCAYFGPLSLPSDHDLFGETPPLCIEGSRQNPFFHWNTSLVAADIDGDGIQDLIFPTSAGFSMFKGRGAWPPVLSVQDADWSFAKADVVDNLTVAVTGDLNGDFVPDLVLFAGTADGPGNARRHAGEGYVFFGPATSWSKRHFDLAVDSPDVIIYGADGTADNPPPFDGDKLGIRREGISLGDIVGDDIPDLIVASEHAAGKDNLIPTVGIVYVLRGRLVWPAIVDLRTPGVADLVVHGPHEESGVLATTVGDINGDNVPDLLLSSRGYSRPGLGRPSSGGIFVISGTGSLSGILDLATTDADATFVGPAINSGLAWSLALGDVNGDGYIDLIAGANEAPLSRPGAGAVIAISGCEGLSTFRDLAVKPAELTIYGADEVDLLGRAVLAVDFDGDGRDDILASAHNGDGLDNLRGDAAGEIHLVLGRPFGTPVCTITPDPGLPIEVCGITTDITLDGSPSVITSCSATPQYRWMDGTTELRGWDVDPTFVVRPTATTDYRLEIRCGDCAGPCFDTATVLVTVDPDVTPPTLGNTVRAYRSGTDVELGWGSVTEARSHSLDRSTTKGVWLPPFLEDIPGTTQTLPDISDPDSYFYRVAGASCSGTEGP